MTVRRRVKENDPFWEGVDRAARELENWPDWKLRSLGMLDSDAARRIIERRFRYPNHCTVERATNTGNGEDVCEEDHD